MDNNRKIKDNYFLILGLGDYEPDPNHKDMSIIGTTDDDKSVLDKIEDVIKSKQKEWTGTTNRSNPTLSKKYANYRANTEEIKSGLATLEAREKEYNAAKKQIADDLEKSLKIATMGKNKITQKQITSIAKKNNLNVNIVEKYIPKGIVIIQDEIPGIELKKPKELDRFKGQEDRLKAYGYADLYAFLGGGTRTKSDSAQVWLKLAHEEIKKYPHDIAKDEISEKRKLCEFCIDYPFTSEANKKEYDDYLAYKEVNDVLNEVRELTKDEKILNKDQAGHFIDELVKVVVDKEKAIAYLLRYCHDKKIAWDSTDASELSSRIRCPHCAQMIDSNAKICTFCGGEVITNCPKCGTENFVGNRFCTNGNCGYDFNNFIRAVALCEKAKNQIDILNLQLAKIFLDEAEELCSSVKEITQLRTEWQRRNDRYGTVADKIKEYADKKNFFAAKKELDSLKSHFPQYSNPELEEAITNAINAARDLLQKAKNENNENLAAKLAVSAYQSCRDYPGTQELLSKFKPIPVRSVVVKADPIRRTNIITWESEKSEITTYRVIRKIGSKPINVDDGDIWWEIASDSYSDKDIEPNTAYCYCIVSCVGPIMSAMVHSASPIVNLFDVEMLPVQNNDSSVYAGWSNVPKNAEVEVWRNIESDPGKPGSGTKVSNVTVNEMADQGLENDVTYNYRVFLKYRGDSGVLYSKGVPFVGNPTAPPQVIDYVIVNHLRDRTFEVEWDADDGEAVSFYLSKEVKVKSKQVIDISELSNLAILANITTKGKNVGEFDLPDSGMYYFFPVTKKKTTAVVGSIVPLSAEKLFDISKVQLSGSDVIIKFEWPAEINHVLLLYRNDRYSTSPEDTEARRMRVSKAMFDQKQAISIKSLPKGTYYFSLFAELKLSGVVTYSIPVFHTFRFGTLSKISYDIKVQKSFGKIKGANVIITPPDDFRLPALIVVANNHSLPVFRNQGFTVCDVPEQESKRPVVVNLPKEQLSKNSFLKIFTKNENEASNYEISLVMGTSPSLK